MQHQCSLCPYFGFTFDELSAHIIRRHKYQKILIHCSACGASFKKVDTFRKHYQRQHFKCIITDSTDCDGTDTVNDDASVVQSDNCADLSKKQEALFLLKLRAGHRLTDDALADVMLATKELLKSRITLGAVPNEAPTDDLLAVDSLFDGLESNFKQEQFFERNFSYVKPIAVKLGEREVLRKHCGKFVPTKRNAVGYCVPFLSQLSALLSMSEVQHCMSNLSDLSDCDNNLMTDIFDGTAMVRPGLEGHEMSHLSFSMYSDELEIVNPIGTHRKVHKITVFYWTLLNIPPAFRHKLHVIQLAAIGKSRDIKEFGYGSLLQDFCSSLGVLHEGVSLPISGFGMHTYTGSLTMVLADTLAAQFLGGFNESVGQAQKPCRMCEVTKQEMREIFFGFNCQARNEEEHRDRMSYLRNANKKAVKYFSRKWGVKGVSILNDIPAFSLTAAILQDPMHVILEGIARYELRALLHSFVKEQKYFTIQTLNDHIRTYQYDSNCRDKPLPIDSSSLERGSTLGQTAASMKSLIIFLPFLIGDAVPEGDEKWLNYLRLLQITLLSISAVASQRTVNSLEQLIASHNFRYCSLYPDEPFTPKFHHLIHFPQQIMQYGPMRNHWCMRYEAKNGFFKQKRLFNFINVPKSLAYHHQRWMCLSMLDGSGQRSQTYLYTGDEVQEGVLVDFESVKDVLPSSIPVTNEVLVTHHICVHGIAYDLGSVLLLSFHEEPEFIKIKQICVVANAKFLVCIYLHILEFVKHKNAFHVQPSSDTITVNVQDLIYKWPQIVHEGDTDMVMLYNCDEVWAL